ncbi:hypothetical protein, partial [Aeromonas sp. HMWF016]|uniref:hypothetical protein n=1 Tax=Aeromonas sp. HMWF016 TaxID=2056852 RepID=UPI001C62CCAF
MNNVKDYLAQPDLPQIKNGNEINIHEIDIAGGVFVRIAPYQTMAIGDYITVTWDNDLVKE